MLFYTACIRSITDYAIPASYHAQYPEKELLRLENRTVSIIVPGASYNTGLEDLGILPLGEHHDQLCNTLLAASSRTQTIRLETRCLQLAAAMVTIEENSTVQFSSTHFENQSNKDLLHKIHSWNSIIIDIFL